MKFDETFPEKPKKANKVSVCSKWPVPWIFPNPATRHNFIWDLSFLKALDRNIVVHYSEWDGQEGQKGWVMTSHLPPTAPTTAPPTSHHLLIAEYNGISRTSKKKTRENNWAKKLSPPYRRIQGDTKDIRIENNLTDSKSWLFGNINKEPYLWNCSKLQLCQKVKSESFAEISQGSSLMRN